MEHQNALHVLLDSDQAQRLRNILTSTPAVALPHSGMGYGIRPVTLDHLLDIMDSMSSTVAELVRRTDVAEVNLAAIKFDLQAAGRILDLMREDPDQVDEMIDDTPEGQRHA
jgi:hypothetical protein